MNEAEFNEHVDRLFEAIEDAVDNCDSDVDSECSAGVLTLGCEDGSALIFSRQPASGELWLAARSGGYHFRWIDQQWYCEKQQQTLAEIFSEACRQQIGEQLDVDYP